MTVFAKFEAGFASASNRQKMQMRIADTVGKGCAVVTAVSVWRWNGRRFKVSVGDRGVGRERKRQDHLMEQGTGHRARFLGGGQSVGPCSRWITALYGRRSAERGYSTFNITNLPSCSMQCRAVQSNVMRYLIE